ncbi:hypothetical protein NXY56_003712 [Leishmania guyanensis]|uniref:Uncharacterized protein n=1 Tax=Leishmania shawi TaxID=5680 RepID=A0ABR3E5C6_9TRYP
MPITEDLRREKTPSVHAQDDALMKYTADSQQVVQLSAAVLDVIVCGRSKTTPFDHAAIVMEVFPEAVRMAEKNKDYVQWPEGKLCIVT